MLDQDCTDIILTGGGIIPDDEIAELEAQGVDKLFGPGTPTDAIIEYIRNEVPKRRTKEDLT